MADLYVVPNQHGAVWTFAASSTNTNPALPFTVWPVSQGSFALDTAQWISLAAAANDHVALTDNAGNLVWENYATGADWDTFPVKMPRVPIFGLILTALDSGILMLTLR